MFLSKPGRGPPPRRDDCGAHGVWRRSLRKRLPPAPAPAPYVGKRGSRAHRLCFGERTGPR